MTKRATKKIRFEKIKTIYRKELKELLKNREITITIIIMPIVFSLLVPASMLALNFTDIEDPGDTSQVTDIFSKIAPYWNDLDNVQKLAVLQANMFLAFLIMIPMVVPMAIASDSIAGEKERKTIESLLAAPISEEEIMIGKALAATIPTIIISWIAEIIYIIFTDVILYNVIGQRIVLPNIFAGIMFILLVPAQTLLSTLIMTAVSSRSRGSREALQKSGFLVAPYMMVIAAIIFVPFVIHPLLTLASGAMIIGLCYLLLKLASRNFKRDKLLSVGS
ncbi:MAG: ABC transporter permease [Asgard group archaeon]|nr:ABC transporter permease [Asgard group archaeon]